MDKTLDPKPVSKKALEDRWYATVAKKSHAKGKEPMGARKRKPGNFVVDVKSLCCTLDRT
jgi:hypothetical protein